ncbi:MAG: HvfC/BufC family peptide modification chaperone [Alphaproteobacteria bacterium]
MSLNKFQTEFKDIMLRPVDELVQAQDNFTELFDDNHISTQERLRVYHNNIVGSLSSALCATFPLLENLVGTDFLKSMARAFIFENPPHSGCLHLYGRGFDSFIKTYEPARNLPYLVDVSTFELAINHAYYAPDDIAMDAERLAQIPPDRLGETIIPLRSSSTLLHSDYPLQDIKGLCEGKTDTQLDLSQKNECYLLINRPQFDVQILPLSADEYTILRTLNDGEALGEAVETVLMTYPDFNFQEFLQKHLCLETLSVPSTNSPI